MASYNKLVRDKIPDIINANDELAEFRILSEEEYLVELNKKLEEELKEYLESRDIEELADLEEVLRAILKIKGFSYEEFETIRKLKADKKGAFNEKIFLENVISKDIKESVWKEKF